MKRPDVMMKTRSAAGSLRLRRLEAEAAETSLRCELGNLTANRHIEAKALAKHIGISAQHLSDILHGRRSISDAVMKRVHAIERID